MKKNRLFTFGCSCTGYHYPTWADLVGSQFKEFYNLGLSGMGNRFIQQMVYEANHHKKFTPDDTVLVMFTSFLRNDVWLTDLKWPSRGPVYLPTNSDIYNDMWKKNHWSLEWGLMDSWSSVNAVKQLLDSTGVKYKLLNAMPLNGNLEEGTGDLDIFDYDISEFRYIDLLDESFPVWYMVEEFGFTKDDLYNFRIDENIEQDLHPTIEMYLKYVKEFLPEFYNEDVQHIGEQCHADLLNIFSKNITQNNFYETVYNNKNFVDIRGKHLGSLRGLHKR
jgi:hypothetical protein